MSIPLDGLLLNTPLRNDSKGGKYLLFLYHAPAEEIKKDKKKDKEGPPSPKSGGKIKKDTSEADLQFEQQMIDLKDRSITLICTNEKEVFDAWVASINKHICLLSRAKKAAHLS